MSDTLVDELQERLEASVARAAEHGDPALGVVELTLRELAELLEMQRAHADQILAREFSAGRQAVHIRRKNATLDAVNLAVIGHVDEHESCALAQRVTDILTGQITLEDV